MLITIFLLSVKSKQTETVLSKREIFIKFLMCILFKGISYRSAKKFNSNNFILKTYIALYAIFFFGGGAFALQKHDYTSFENKLIKLERRRKVTFYLW